MSLIEKSDEDIIKIAEPIWNNLIKSSNPDIQRLELSISEKLGAKLNIDHKAKGNGRIIIRYNSLDELEGIIDHIK